MVVTTRHHLHRRGRDRLRLLRRRRGAGYAQVQAELDAAAQTAAAYVQTTDTYQPCATTTTYALPAPPAEITSAVTQVNESASTSNPGYPGTECFGGQVIDYGVQEITIRLSDGSNW